MGRFTGVFYARSLQMTTHITVIFPEESNDVTPVQFGEPRVLYLLHGLSGSCEEWTRFSKIEYYAKKYNLIIIMPEVQRSFYCDGIAGPQYFTYVADELPQICDKWFRLNTSRENTFIAGESMGGYGAVKIALRRPERFEAVASLSGTLDYPALIGRVLRGEWTDVRPQELRILHDLNTVTGGENDVVALVRRTAGTPRRPRLIQLCGTEDFLYTDNQRFRHAADEAGYGHTYLESPGDHEWPYWDKAIQRAIQFFCKLDLNTTPIY